MELLIASTFAFSLLVVGVRLQPQFNEMVEMGIGIASEKVQPVSFYSYLTGVPDNNEGVI